MIGSAKPLLHSRDGDLIKILIHLTLYSLFQQYLSLLERARESDKVVLLSQRFSNSALLRITASTQRVTMGYILSENNCVCAFLAKSSYKCLFLLLILAQQFRLAITFLACPYSIAHSALSLLQALKGLL